MTELKDDLQLKHIELHNTFTLKSDGSFELKIEYHLKVFLRA